MDDVEWAYTANATKVWVKAQRLASKGAAPDPPGAKCDTYDRLVPTLIFIPLFTSFICSSRFWQDSLYVCVCVCVYVSVVQWLGHWTCCRPIQSRVRPPAVLQAQPHDLRQPVHTSLLLRLGR